MNIESKLALAIKLLNQVSRELKPLKTKPPTNNLPNIDTLTINFETLNKASNTYLLVDSLSNSLYSKHIILKTLKYHEIIATQSKNIRIEAKIKRTYKITDIDKLDRLKQKN